MPYKRRRSPSGGSRNVRRRLPSFGTVMNTAIGLYDAYKGYKYLTGTDNSTSGQGVTAQYDRKVVYKKKRMPRRKRRRWARFIKKVNAVTMKTLGTKSVLYNNQLSTTTPGTTQAYAFVCLYGRDGASSSGIQCGANDMRLIMNNDPQITTTSKIMVGSAILDVTFTNVSSGANEQQSGIELDIYDIVFRKDDDSTQFIQMITKAETETPLIGTTGASVLLSTRGVTPWELPSLLANGVKIIKKTKYFLGSGDCGTYQIRDAKNRILRKSYVEQVDDQFIYPGYTRGLLFVHKGVPTPIPANQVTTTQIGVTRKYMYKIMQNQGDSDGVYPQ